MKKRRIVIASILKPVDDTRMYEKMAMSLTGELNTYVTIIGQPTASIPAHTNIQFVPLLKARRLSIVRVLLPIYVGWNVLKVKPQLLIVNTHELLIVSCLIRILFGVKIVYDIRENYYRNIRYSEAFVAPLRLLIAGWVRSKEKLTSLLISHFILAETVYEKELSFLNRKYTVVENRAALPPHFQRSPQNDSIHLLFSGTISRSTGVFEAIRWATMLHQHDNRTKLTIIGFCALHDVEKELESAVANKPFIILVGIKELIPHSQIVEAIGNSHFGIIHYPSSPHTYRAMPTKLYEYMAAALPILTSSDQHFATMVTDYKAGLIWMEDAKGLLDLMKSETFYSNPARDVYWEGTKLTALINRLCPDRL